MKLRGQHGYAMVALLVGMSIMAVLMTAAMPVWNQAARREKEAELVFRGQQYARAIGLFQRKSGPGVLPPNLDVLVDQKFLRKKYKDPITGEDFDPLIAGLQAPGSTNPGGPSAPGQRGTGPPGGQGAVVSPQQGRGGAVGGGIMGVASKSKSESLRVYNGRTRYNEWQFLYVAQTIAPGLGDGANPPGRGGVNPPIPGAPPGRGGVNPPVGGRGFDGGRGGGRGQGQPPRGGGAGGNPFPGGANPFPGGGRP